MNANEIINEKQNTNTSSTLTVLRLKYFTSDNFINKFDKVLIVSIVIRDLINLTKEKELNIEEIKESNTERTKTKSDKQSASTREQQQGSNKKRGQENERKEGAT